MRLLAALTLILILAGVLVNSGWQLSTTEEKISSRGPASLKRESDQVVQTLKSQENRIEELRSELSLIALCAANDNCATDSDDPKASHFTAAEGAVRILNELRKIKKQNSAADFELVAREWLKFPDDHVREAALELLSDHHASGQTLHALLEGLEESISAPLIEKAIPVLVSYSQAGYAEEVQSFVAKTVIAGPLGVGEVLASQAIRFLDKNSLPKFRTISENLPVNSQSRRNLEANIREYERREGGG